MSKDRCILTPEGYMELEAELNNLKTVKRPEIIEALKEARSLGDLSENADYDAARDEQAKIETKIKELEYKLDNCEIVNLKKCSNKVCLGSTVTIEYEDKTKEEYKIVGSLEADLLNNKISIESPIGSALLDKSEKDIVEVNSPSGVFKIKIVKIK